MSQPQEIQRPQFVPVPRVRFGKVKTLQEGKFIPTEQIDVNTLILTPTGNRKFSTLLKNRNGSMFLYSKGLRIDLFDVSTEGVFTMKVNLGKDLTMQEYQNFIAWIAKVKNNGGK